MKKSFTKELLRGNSCYNCIYYSDSVGTCYRTKEEDEWPNTAQRAPKEFICQYHERYKG